MSRTEAPGPYFVESRPPRFNLMCPARSSFSARSGHRDKWDSAPAFKEPTVSAGVWVRQWANQKPQFLVTRAVAEVRME